MGNAIVVQKRHVPRKPLALATTTSPAVLKSVQPMRGQGPAPTTTREHARREARHHRMMMLRHGLAEIRTRQEAAGEVAMLMLEAAEVQREAVRLDYARVGALALAKRFKLGADELEGIFEPVEGGFEVLTESIAGLRDGLERAARALVRLDGAK